MTCIHCGDELRQEWLAHVRALRLKHGHPDTPPKLCEVCLLRAILQNPDEMLSQAPREEKRK
jgi:hypothetical protein